MALNIGDRVRFLNDVGGGYITKFQSKNVVLVMQDDGFEVPILTKEIVVVESVSKEAPSAKAAPRVEEDVEDDDYSYEETPEGDQLKLIFALVPQDAKNIPGMGLDIYLVNDSNYFISFVIAESDKQKLHPVANGLLEPNTKELIQGFSLSDLAEVNAFSVQGIAFKKDKPYQEQEVLQRSIAINAVKLSKATSYQRNEYFHEPAVITEISIDPLQQKVEELTQQQTQEIVKEKERRPRVKKSASPKVNNNIVEVDLHIHELLDNTAGMSNGEMLGYQMDTFHQTLEEYKNKKGQKIVFIHGVGNGTLKNDLRKELDRKYKYSYQDASFREYGFGATMVIIK